MKHGFVKVAAATPSIRVADCGYNAAQIVHLMQESARLGVKALVFPELCLTGVTCGDLFFQDTLLDGAEDALERILEETVRLEVFTVVGLPVRYESRLYNCAAVLFGGELLALVPKTHLSAGECRWFTPAPGASFDTDCQLAGQQAPLSANQLFTCNSLPSLTIGVEVGEDLLAPVPPAAALAARGATLILNPAAPSALAGYAPWYRSQVLGQSGRLMCGYVRAGAGEGESTTDLVYDGQRLVAENGALLAESRFDCGLTVSEMDTDSLLFERRRAGLFPPVTEDCDFRHYFTPDRSLTTLTRPVPANPFVPEDEEAAKERFDEILRIAALGLKKRLEHTGAPCAVVGLSGGLDSTLAILTAAAAFDLMGRGRKDIVAVTMPCFGTTQRTKSNAEALAEELGATLKVIDISDAVRQHFADIGHDMDDHSVTFENAQARERTQVLMDVANKLGGLVIGTGDLSELALGWATYNGDHMSMYSVNGSIPKTLMRHLVSHVAEEKGGRLEQVLRDILDTPVSPELLPPKDGEIAQRTEDLVGPYELHDFCLYYTLRRGFPPKKVFRLAEHALGDKYDRDTLLKWLKNFYRRFFSQQFKRSCLPDGPKVGALSLSPRGDWVMPSDAVAALWLRELEELG